MAHDDGSLDDGRSFVPSTGLAVVVPDAPTAPALPPHRERVTDKDPAKMRSAVRTVYTWFYLSVAGSIWAIAAYMLFPIEDGRWSSISENNMFIGIGSAFALLAIGIGAIHWSKAVMSDREFIEPRHATLLGRVARNRRRRGRPFDVDLRERLDAHRQRHLAGRDRDCRAARERLHHLRTRHPAALFGNRLHRTKADAGAGGKLCGNAARLGYRLGPRRVDQRRRLGDRKA